MVLDNSNQVKLPLPAQLDPQSLSNDHPTKLKIKWPLSNLISFQWPESSWVTPSYWTQLLLNNHLQNKKILKTWKFWLALDNLYHKSNHPLLYSRRLLFAFVGDHMHSRKVVFSCRFMNETNVYIIPLICQ